MNANVFTKEEVDFLKNILDQKDGIEDADIADSIFGKLKASEQQDEDPNQVSMELDGHLMTIRSFELGD